MGVELRGRNCFLQCLDGERRSPECFHGEFTAKPFGNAHTPHHDPRPWETRKARRREECSYVTETGSGLASGSDSSIHWR